MRAHPVLFSAIGNDFAGAIFLSSCQEMGLETRGVHRHDGRLTSTKLRVFARGHQVARVDRETSAPIPAEIQAILLDQFLRELPTFDGVILEDYNKGVLPPSLVRELVNYAAGVICGKVGVAVASVDEILQAIADEEARGAGPPVASWPHA